MKALLLAGIALAISGPAFAGSVPTTYASKTELDDLGSGSGVVVGPHEVLTASHVVDGCTAINVLGRDAYVAANDEGNDLAVVHTKDQWATWAIFSNEPVHAGDAVVAMGYPLSGFLADTANVSVGNVSAMAGPFNDSRLLQMTAPIQPGNSGGGLFDGNGGIIGIVQSKLDALKAIKNFGDIPQNVNFAIKAETARAFLDSKNVKYQMSPNLGKKLSAAEVGNIARPFTVRIKCYGKEGQVATTKSESPAPQRPTTPPQQAPLQQPPSLPAQPSLPTQPSNYYRVTQNLMLRMAPSKYSDNALAGYPHDYIPEGAIFNYGPYHCTYGSGMYGQTNEVWCSVEYPHDRGVITKGWISAHFLRDNYGVLLACRYATPDPECTDPRYPRY